MNNDMIKWYNSFSSINITRLDNGYMVETVATGNKRFFESGYYTNKQIIAYCDAIVTKFF